MNIDLPLASPHKRLLRVGFMAGAFIGLLDIVVFGGEMNPTFTVILLLVSAFVFGVLWGKAAWRASFYAWIVFPLVHFARPLLGLTQPPADNWYLAVLMLGGLTLVVAAFGTAIGNLFHKTLIRP